MVRARRIHHAGRPPMPRDVRPTRPGGTSACHRHGPSFSPIGAARRTRMESASGPSTRVAPWMRPSRLGRSVGRQTSRREAANAIQTYLPGPRGTSDRADRASPLPRKPVTRAQRPGARSRWGRCGRSESPPRPSTAGKVFDMELDHERGRLVWELGVASSGNRGVRREDRRPHRQVSARRSTTESGTTCRSTVTAPYRTAGRSPDSRCCSPTRAVSGSARTTLIGSARRCGNARRARAGSV